MSSIMTNSGAIAALDTLRTVGRNMSETQREVATGLRVGASKDNAAYWSIATTMRSDDKAMSAVQDALALGAASVDVAYIGMSNALDVMDDFKAKLVAAREPGVDRTKITSELNELRNQLRTIAESSSFNGENWLITQDGSIEPTRSLVTSFIRGSDNTVRVGALDYGITNNGERNRLIDENSASAGTDGLLTMPSVAPGFDMTGPLYDVFLLGKDPWLLGEEIIVDAETTNEEIDLMIQFADYTIRGMASAAATLGTMANYFDRQSEFVQDLRDTATKGVGRLRDSNLNDVSARLKALQTQEQLGLQALSIANSNSENIVSLFR
ncbi:MAG: flagellin [Rhizobium sp.]|nr:flagellin [Rhizobium sp.]